jgi:hypothetical protein
MDDANQYAMVDRSSPDGGMATVWPNGARQGRAATAMKVLEDGAARQEAAEGSQRTLGRSTLEDAHSYDALACPNLLLHDEVVGGTWPRT